MMLTHPGIEDNPCIEVCDTFDKPEEPTRFSIGCVHEEPFYVVANVHREVSDTMKIKPHKTYQKFNRRERWQR